MHIKDPKDMVAGEQVGPATCIIDVLSVTMTLAQIAADTIEVTRTCESVKRSPICKRGNCGSEGV